MAHHKSLDIGHIAARLLSVTLPMGLTLDEIIIQGDKLHLAKEPLTITLAEPGSMEVRVSEEALCAFLEKKAPGGLSDFRVTIGENAIRIEAKASIIISISVAAICKLRIEGGEKLYVDLVKVEAIGGTGAHNIVQRQLDNINPVVEVEDLPVQATLTSVEMEEHWVMLRGTIAPKTK